MQKRTTGIILHGFDFKEADQIITLFSKDLGKIKMIAKGVKKPKSSLRGIVQPFCCGDYYLAPSRDMYILSQGKPIAFFGNIRTDLDKTLQAVYMMEVLNKGLAERDPHPELFQLTMAVLHYIDSQERSNLILRLFELNVLVLLGFEPMLDACAVCGSGERLNFFQSDAGGMVCAGCAGRIGAYPVMPAAAAALRALRRHGLAVLPRLRLQENVEREVETMLEDYLGHYLETRFLAKGVMKEIKRML